MSVHVTVHNTMEGFLDAMSARCTDLRPALRRCGLALQRSFMEQFRVSGVPPWKPLSLATIMGRRRGRSKRRDVEPRPLIDTGLLRRSYTSRAGYANIWREGPDWLTIGSNVEYAGKHQHGVEKTPNNPGIPARPLRILLSDVLRFREIITDWVRRGR